MGGVGGSGGATRPPSVFSFQLTGQSKHGCSAVICLVLAHATPCCTALLLLYLMITQTTKDKYIILCLAEVNKKVKLNLQANCKALMHSSLTIIPSVAERHTSLRGTQKKHFMSDYYTISKKVLFTKESL